MRLVSAIALFLLLGGCSGSNEKAAIRDRQLDYQAAYVEPKLKVPEELSNVRVMESLKIPGVDEPTAGLYGGSFEAPRAEAALRTQTLPSIRRYQIGDLHWLAIPEAPSIIWADLEQFIIENKLLVSSVAQEEQIQSLISNTFKGVNKHSGSRIIRHFAPEVGQVALRLSLEVGLRQGTSEVRLAVANENIDDVLIGRVLDEFKYYLERTSDESKAVSRALASVEADSRISSRRIEGMDELIVDANILRVYAVTVDVIRDLDAAIVGGDLARGLLNIQYVRKSTERRLEKMSVLNRSIATTIENPVGNFQVQMNQSSDGVIVKVVPVGGAASIGGANELVRHFQERLY